MKGLPLFCKEGVAGTYNSAYNKTHDASSYQPANNTKTCDWPRKVDVLFAAL